MLKKLFILNIVLMFISISGLCFSDEELEYLENSRYGQSFPDDNLSSRLNRLETDFLGMSQSGDVNSRIDRLMKMLDNSQRSAVVFPQDNFYPGKKKSGIRNFWDNLTSSFNDEGIITGYTPPVNTMGYGYSNNMYKNSYLNFMNNPERYCPFSKKYYNNRYNNRAHYNPRRYPINSYNSPYRRGVIPSNAYTNVMTGTSVHIMDD